MEQATLNLKRFPKNKAPMMFHEQVGEGDLDGAKFTVIRDVTAGGFHMQVKMGEEVVAFNIYEIITQIVTGETPKPKYEDGRPCCTDIFLVHVKEHEEDHYALEQRIDDWLHGAWDDALEGLPPLPE